MERRNTIKELLAGCERVVVFHGNTHTHTYKRKGKCWWWQLSAAVRSGRSLSFYHFTHTTRKCVDKHKHVTEPDKLCMLHTCIWWRANRRCFPVSVGWLPFYLDGWIWRCGYWNGCTRRDASSACDILLFEDWMAGWLDVMFIFILSRFTGIDNVYVDMYLWISYPHVAMEVERNKLEKKI